MAHPQLRDSGTQQFLKDGAAVLENVTWHELKVNATGHFDIMAEKKLLRSHERVVFQFPLYWYAAPAVLKQWVDEVLAVSDKRWLQEKELGLVVSVGQPLKEYRLGGREAIPLSELLSPFKALAQRLKMQLMPLFIVEQFSYQSEKQRQKLLIDYQQLLELPRDFSFKQRQDWFEDKLKKMIAVSNIKNKKELELVLNTFTARREQLNDLKDDLSFTKKENEFD
ncbi:hypothetical protein FC81_GL000569 [Liquorilactobacillus capillatus DSM 19910]|uniref:Flavodoxin-like fold domain-containing protein n=1 Tax=Liquorilactobacillus capillatus DSM 19910 TaxID=1423731 RepID=A0A0R1MCI6_9LACO|nr:hypothetical protein FC81_GL000569 [Liquorilactobacillus capillatus DSM 19910]